MKPCKTGKIGFESYRLAMKVNGKMRDHNGAHSVYRCPFCGQWHVGTRLHRTISKRPAVEDRDDSF